MSPEHLFRDEAGQPAPSVARLTAFAALFSAVVVIASIAIRTLFLGGISYSAGEVFSEKLDYLSSSSADENVYFVGTSHIYRSIDPQQFDAECHDSGIDAKSYNAGVFRLGYLEADLLLERIISRVEPGKPWLVVMEPSLRDCDFVNWSSERELFTHDPKQTVRAVRYHWLGICDGQSVYKQLRHAAAMAAHLGSGLLYQLNYGKASRVVFPMGDGFVTRSFGVPFANGFLPLDREERRPSDHPPLFDDPAKFGKLLEVGTSRRSKSKAEPMRSTIRLYEEIAEKIETAGGRFALITTPRFTIGAPHLGDDIDALLRYPPATISRRLLGDYRYSPENEDLFQARYWFDPEHLGQAGATAFSKKLASDIAANHRDILPTEK